MDTHLEIYFSSAKKKKNCSAGCGSFWLFMAIGLIDQNTCDTCRITYLVVTGEILISTVFSFKTINNNFSKKT